MPPVSEAQRRWAWANKNKKTKEGKAAAEYAAADPGGKLPGYSRKSHHKGNPGFPSTDSSSPPGLNEIQTTTEPVRPPAAPQFQQYVKTPHAFNVGHAKDGKLRNSGHGGAHRIGKRR